MRVIAGSRDLDRWLIDCVIVGGKSISGPPAPLPAVVFASTAMGADLDVSLMDGDYVSVQATLLGVSESSLMVDVVVRPDEVLTWCQRCGASLWSANEADALRCGRCGGEMDIGGIWEPWEK